MRSYPAALAVLGLVTVGLAGCSLPNTADCSRPAVSDADVMDLIEVKAVTAKLDELLALNPTARLA